LWWFALPSDVRLAVATGSIGSTDVLFLRNVLQKICATTGLSFLNFNPPIMDLDLPEKKT